MDALKRVEENLSLRTGGKATSFQNGLGRVETKGVLKGRGSVSKGLFFIADVY